LTAHGREETTEFQPAFDDRGLIAAVIVDERDGAVLMVGWMNAEALNLTIASGKVHFWSRSRARLWMKGETSGETLGVREILVDCDQDALVVRATREGKGATCHTGRVNCFYRRLTGGKLEMLDSRRLIDPEKVYGA
jgi:phosphoribosyl-AMP cyclohydrolase